MPSRIDRRSFLTASLATGAAILLPGSRSFAATKTLGPNDEIGVGMIGAGGRAGELLSTVMKVPGVKVLSVADPDSKRAESMAKKCGAVAHQDLRKIIEDPNIHAVFIATCNHWHCLAAMWAMEAGKDVYVEKPLSHTQWEGRQVVNAARKYNRIVQVGTQQRSDPMQAELKKFLHEDKSLGAIEYVQANRLGARAPIGKRKDALAIPKEVNYDLWLGPAEDQPLLRNALHYDWHWTFNTGNGEMGNWGVHVLDDVRNVAYQDSVSLPNGVFAVGGRVAWDDAGDTPNVHYAIFETDSFPTLIALSNLAGGKELKGSWDSKAGRPDSGPGSGYVVACEGGYLLGQRQGARAIDRDGKTIRSFKGGDIVRLHIENFFAAMRSRDQHSLNAEVQIGHDSTGWCNLANVGYQTASSFDAEQVKAAGASIEAWPKLMEEVERQLQPLNVKVPDLLVSPKLSHDAKTERFVGDHADIANKFLKRTSYRKGYEFPEIG
jgi:predicted dehydrogenase